MSAENLHSALVPRPRVGIVLLNWNGLDRTVRCLDSLEGLSYPDFAVFVVDNGSRDGSVPALSERARASPFPLRLLANPQNLGFAEGSNVGARAAVEDGCELVLLLNNDTIVRPGFLEPLVAELLADDGVAAAAPKVLYLEDPARLYSSFDRPNLWLWSLLPTTRGRRDDPGDLEPRDVETLIGCAFLVRAGLVRAGLFDPEYFAYYEEVDLFLRLREAGRRLRYVPRSVVLHEGEASLGRSNPALAYLKMRNLILVVRKRGRWWHWTTFLPILCSLVLVRFLRGIVRGNFREAVAVVRGLLWHVRYLRRVMAMEECLRD